MIQVLSLHTPLTPGLGSKGKKKTESGHVARKRSVDQYAAKTMTLYTPLTCWVRLKGQILKLCR